MRAVPITIAVCLGLCAPAVGVAADDTDFFESRVRPILVEHCVVCHGEAKQKGGLRLDTKAGWERGGDNGPAVVPGHADKSLLVRMVKGVTGAPPEMPPEGVLPASAVADLAKWVEIGAPDPRTGTAAPVARQIDWAAAAEFWAFRPVAAREPTAAAADDAVSPIDRFIRAKLAEAGLTPVGPADRRTLLRRATFGLTGLPPTEPDVRAFEADPSPDAFAKVVDRLLASPHYGEHQARAWLDLARYGEDQADKEGDEGKLAHAWRYRDWVIEAFNRDVPYDRFVKLQLAADLMETPASDPADRRALGFLGLGAVYARPNDLDLKRAEEWDDRVDTLTRAFLGLTVACARCHDHKYDPIPTQDYYSLAGVVAGTKNVVLPVAPPAEVAAHEAASARAAEAADRAKAFVQAESDRLAREKAGRLAASVLAAWDFAARRLDNPAAKPDDAARAVGVEPAALLGVDRYLRKGNGRDKRLAEWEKLLPTERGPREPPAEVRELASHFQAYVLANLDKPAKGRNGDVQNELFGEKGVFPLTDKVVLARAAPGWAAEYAKLQEAAKAAAAAVPDLPRCNGAADAEKPADLRVYLRGNPAGKGEVAPRRFLRVLAGPDPVKFTKGSGRLELAEAVADPRNPLTARVMVNRIWQQHFDRGIVATASNFGALGERPTHPELLDYLADRFVRDGWSVKRLHREIMLTAAYRRVSTGDAANEERDPENRWLWRVSRRRLTVEAFRDATLAAAGALDRTAGGPGGDVDDVAFARRTVYGRVSRHDTSKLLRLFDFPAPNISSDRRTDTILPQQALFLMNSPFMADRARALAARCADAPGPEAQARQAYWLTFAREPTEAESEAAVRFLSATDPVAPSSTDSKKAGREPMTRAERFAQVLLASNEFMFVD